VWRLAVVSLCVLVLAGCGEDEPTPPPRPVALTVLAPNDPETVEGSTIQVRGRVVPAASEVRVLGQDVDVASGTFVVDVPLDEGMNLVDISAAAPGRRPASTAIRVVRDPRVEVPAVEGSSEEEAVSQLEDLGFAVERRDGGSILDDLLGGDPQVCKQDPPAGTKVKRGSKVEIITARSC
jgi:hypothetical protein